MVIDNYYGDSMQINIRDFILDELDDNEISELLYAVVLRIRHNTLTKTFSNKAVKLAFSIVLSDMNDTQAAIEKKNKRAEINRQNALKRWGKSAGINGDAKTMQSHMQNLCEKNANNKLNNTSPKSLKSLLETFVQQRNELQAQKEETVSIEALNDAVLKMGTNTNDVIKKEHFDIAIKKVIIGNCITTLKNISRIDFLKIFEKTNGVEEILKNDPAGVYEKMDYKTKTYYRGELKELANKTKISEIYIAKKLIDLATNKEGKEAHIGYYLIDKGRDKLLKERGK